MRPLRIGIDARPLRGATIGAGRALGAVLTQWEASGAGGHEFFLYAPQPIERRFAPPFHLRVGSGVGRLTGGSVWLQTELPLMAKRDALDVFWAPMDIVPVPIARRLPCLLMIHDVGYFKIPELFPLYMRWTYRFLFRPSIAAAARIACTTGAVREDVIAAGKPDKDVEVIMHGVDFDRFTAARAGGSVAQLGLTPGYFLYVGHLRQNKNLERTLEAYRRFLKRHGKDAPDFVIAGGRTSTDAPTFALITAPDLREKVRYIGFVEERDLGAVYGNAMAFVSPSVYEGFGLPYLEAMAAGLAVLAPRIPTAMEVCGDCALYVDPLSVDSIAEGLETLFADPTGRRDLAARGHERAKEMTWAASARKVLRALEGLAAR